jgi:hypothetical protein
MVVKGAKFIYFKIGIHLSFGKASVVVVHLKLPDRLMSCFKPSMGSVL